MIVAQRAWARSEGGVNQYRAWRAIGENAGVLGRGMPPVQWHYDRAGPRAGEQQGEHFGVVAPKIGYQVATPHAKRRQPAAGAPNAFGKRRVIQVVSGEPDCQLVRRERRRPLNPMRQVHASTYLPPTSMTTAIAVSPAAHPVNRPVPPPRTTSSSINSMMERVPMGACGWPQTSEQP